MTKQENNLFNFEPKIIDIQNEKEESISTIIISKDKCLFKGSHKIINKALKILKKESLRKGIVKFPSQLITKTECQKV